MDQRYIRTVLQVSAIALLFNLGIVHSTYITDLTVVEGPYYRIPNGYEINRMNLNIGTHGGNYLAFAVKKENSAKDALTDITVVTGSNEHVPIPDGYVRVPTNLNAGIEADHVYAAYSRDVWRGYPITSIIVLTCGVLPCSCTGQNVQTIPVDLNRGAKGKYVFLCLRRVVDLCPATGF